MDQSSLLVLGLEDDLTSCGFRQLVHGITSAKQSSTRDLHYRLRLLQVEVNFPFLYLASIKLHRIMLQEGYDRLLMCSRDAFLWHPLQTRIREAHATDAYEVRYFYTSRITRWFPSADTLRYTNSLLTNKTLIVDLCGTGRSLLNLTQSIKPSPAVFIVVGYPNRQGRLTSGVPCMVRKQDNTAVELANLANHPMVGDVRLDANGSYSPVFVNPVCVSWRTHPAIRAMHEAFTLVLSTTLTANIADDLTVDDSELLRALANTYSYLEKCDGLLKEELFELFSAEEGYTRRRLMDQALSSNCKPIYRET